MAKDLNSLAAAAEEEKTRLKEEKKQLKKDRKAQKKEAKRRAAEIEKQEEALGDDGGSGFVTFGATLLIVALWVAIVCVVIKMDVGGFGSSVMTPILKDVPVLNRILPSASPAPGDTEEEENYGGYSSLEEAVEYIRQLEAEVERIQTTSSAKDTELEALKAEILRLQEFEQRQVEFQRIKTEFYEEVASLDPDGLLKYYESIDPATMEYIAKQIAVQQQKSEEAEAYLETFAVMKPKAVAKLFETMSDRLELVAEILEGMDVEQRAAIMNVIDAEIGAKLVKMMHPDS